jgi:hypothetical protein
LGVSTTVTAVNYDANSIRRTIPIGTAAYVQAVMINGKPAASTCHIDFYDTFRVGGNVTIVLTADKAAVGACNGTVPDSLSSGECACFDCNDSAHASHRWFLGREIRLSSASRR